ncbi:N-acetylmuramoyl-L-alanine amidase AmiA [Biostraticola tofi]|uniref:N-acetylmuramoyl-L-alanine amidase AmiA n=1 Tax=Biostraticola tofi TaxID=466109 RepID=A0A4R3YYI6_9GAMM|nr:N-acetylmuramoyl-L-alanine amidase AmiA [Biostraticola tofi]TCV98317.1 N-acetylmuramoyl-L-alanine amidase [Biostraticola tofi]
MKNNGRHPSSLRRRQLLLTGLAAALAGLPPVFAHAEQTASRLLPRKTARSVAKPAGGKKIIMLDPGHGGIDSGAIGHGGAEEKHIVLEIANHLRAKLNGLAGYDVRLTRESDHFIPLAQRVEIAHQHGADLFMSIHADGFTDSAAHGASVFALSNRGASSAMARYLSQKENAVDRLGGIKTPTTDDYLKTALFDLVQTDTINNSLILGKHILNHIRPVHTLHSQHTEQAAFAVLKSPSIPSVLVETSFITNPAEERLLGSNAFRDKIASAIAASIVSFYDAQPATRHR